MQKQSIRFEGISIPIKFATVHADEASFLKQGKKQFFLDKSPDQQEKLLKEMYKQCMDTHKANEAQVLEEVKDPAAKYKGWASKRLKNEAKTRKIEFAEDISDADLIQLLVNFDANPPEGE